MKKSSTKSSNQSVNHKTLILTLLACAFLLVSNSAIWANKVLFNRQKFTIVATTAFSSQSSRDSIAAEIVSRTLESRPIAARVVEEPATKLVSGMLDSSIAASSTEKFISNLHIMLTSKEPKNLEYDISGTKNLVTRIVQTVGEDSSVTNLQALPDKIVILDSSKLPNFYPYANTLLWLAPVTTVLALLFLAAPHVLKKALDASTLAVQGFLLIATGAGSLVLGPLFRPPLLSQIPSPNIRIVVENIYNSFIATFNSQSYWFFYTGLLLVILSLLVRMFNEGKFSNFINKLKK